MGRTESGAAQASRADGESEALMQLERAREAMTHWNERALAFIRERPGACLLGALAAGFIVGRIASRR